MGDVNNMDVYSVGYQMHSFTAMQPSANVAVPLQVSTNTTVDDLLTENIIDLLLNSIVYDHIVRKVFHYLGGKDVHAVRATKKSWRDIVQAMWRVEADRELFGHMLNKQWLYPLKAPKERIIYKGVVGAMKFRCRGDSIFVEHWGSQLMQLDRCSLEPMNTLQTNNNAGLGVWDIHQDFVLVYDGEKQRCWDRNTTHEVELDEEMHIDEACLKIKIVGNIVLMLYASGLVLKYYVRSPSVCDICNHQSVSFHLIGRFDGLSFPSLVELDECNSTYFVMKRDKSYNHFIDPNNHFKDVNNLMSNHKNNRTVSHHLNDIAENNGTLDGHTNEHTIQHVRKTANLSPDCDCHTELHTDTYTTAVVLRNNKISFRVLEHDEECFTMDGVDEIFDVFHNEHTACVMLHRDKQCIDESDYRRDLIEHSIQQRDINYIQVLESSRDDFTEWQCTRTIKVIGDIHGARINQNHVAIATGRGMSLRIEIYEREKLIDVNLTSTKIECDLIHAISMEGISMQTYFMQLCRDTFLWCEEDHDHVSLKEINFWYL